MIRTFGSDLDLVADAITAFADGKHPDYPSPCPEMMFGKEAIWTGRYDSDGVFKVNNETTGQVCFNI